MGVKAVDFSTELTLGVQRNMVRAITNWRFPRWSVSESDLDTYVSLYYKPLHQCADDALATVDGLWRLKT